MSGAVIDASVTLAWCFQDEATPFTASVFRRIEERGAIVPTIWELEVANAVLNGRRRGRLTAAEADEFFDALRRLPIHIEPRTGHFVWSSTTRLADDQRLTIYDASYLDLALRERLPLATLDERLRSAARLEGVVLVELDDPARSERSTSTPADTVQSASMPATRGTSVADMPVVAFKSELFSLFDETFETVSGHYLDRGTSLFETLKTVDAGQASTPLSDSCGTIAAQVNHVAFYLDVIGRYFQGEDPGKVDWGASWAVGAVTETEWIALKARLRESHARTRALLTAQTDFSTDTDRIGEAISFVVHTAHHLGEIRQALCTIRGSAS